MKRLLLILVALLGVLLIAGGIVWGSYRRIVYAEGHPDPSQETTLIVPKGTTGKGLGPLLAEQGLIADAKLWRFYLFSHAVLPKAGRFKVLKGMSIPQLAQVLAGTPLPEDDPFTYIEGWRLRDADAALVAKGWLPPGRFESAARTPRAFKAPFPLPKDSLEGYLYPQTYGVVSRDMDPAALIQRQLDMFVHVFYEPYKDEITASGHTLHELATMASLLEREEPNPDNRPTVAGILWKRLQIGMPLGVDATSRYVLPEWNDRRAFLEQLRDGSSPWNTRLKKGLPPGPIGAPSLGSLLAALRPVSSEYWFYLHDATGAFHPSHNAAEHAELRAKYNIY